MKSARNKRGPDPQRSDAVINRISHAVRKEPWKNTVLQLAWTAGPVTYLALQGGYYIGYGKSAPGNLFIYFAIYTLLAGLFAVVIRFFYNATRGREIEESKSALISVSDRLLEYIFLLRDINLQSMDSESAVHYAARLLLENPDANERAVGAAVKDLTGRDDLADAVMRIEVFRKNGLRRRIYEERASLEKRLTREYNRISVMSRETADLLLKRFSGHAPAKRQGRQRMEGFLERIFSAGENNDLSLMSSLDGKEMFIFTLECMLGREFTYYTLRYAGNREITDSFNRLDKARHSYRSAIFSRNSRLRVLLELCHSAESVHRIAAAINSIRTTEEILKNIHLAIEEFGSEVKKITNRFSRKERLSSEIRGELNEKIEHLKTVLKLYRSLTVVNGEVRKQHGRLLKAEQRYAEITEKHGKVFPLRFLTEHQKGMGIKIEERTLKLSDGDRLSIAKQLNEKMDELGDLHEGSEVDDFKELAFEAAKIINRKIPIAEEAVMLAVEQTNSAFLTALETDLSTKTKLDWAISLIQDLTRDTRRAIHRIAAVLVAYHGVRLSEEDIDYLENAYGGDREYLSGLAPREDGALKSSVQRIVEIPPLNPAFYGILKGGMEALSRK